MRRWKLFPRRHMFGAFAVCLIALGLLPGTAAAAEPPIRFELGLRSPGECVYVFTATDTPTDVTLRSASGQLKAQVTMAPDEYYFCLDGSTWVDSGDKLKASDGSYTRKFVVPDLSVEIDRVHNVYMGSGPAGRTVFLDYPGSLFGDVGETAGARVGEDGNWSFNPHHDLVWSMGGYVSWRSPNGDKVHASGAVPFMTLTIGKAGFSGWTSSLGHVDASLTDGHAGIASVVADIRGAFAGKFLNSNGRAVKAAAGDRFMAPSLASDADWVVPDIEATANATNDVVQGDCQRTGSVSDLGNVQVVRSGHVRGRAYVGLDESGHFRIDFGGRATPGFTPANIKSGDTISVGCMIATGDWVQRSFTAP